MSLEPHVPQPSQPSPAPSTRVYGVLGGIASGKSAVARLLAGEDGEVLDADQLVGELHARPDFRTRVAEAFGPSVIASDGSLDRAALARAVFADQAARRLLESWTHPEVRVALRERLEAARAAGVPRVVLDVPLLLENESEHFLPGECDALIFVETSPEVRDARAVASRGWKSGEVARREAQQMPLAEKRARAAHVIHNDGDPARLRRAVQEILRELEPSRA